MTTKRFGGFWDFFGRGIYVLLAIILSIPLFIIIDNFLNTVNVHEDEAVATASTMAFFLGVFTGRYFAGLWLARKEPVTSMMIVILCAVSVVCVVWLFFHADFPWRGRTALNLLLFWIPFGILSICSGILVKFIRVLARRQLLEARAQAEQSKSELKLLQSQLSPHFLFNTLNNLYGLSLTQHEKIPPLLLKLSELLRYSVYETTEAFVPLKDELTYIQNYIAFERIRIDDKLELRVDLEEPPASEIRIAPMLMIIFVENAFKHARNTSSEKIFIDIGFKVWEEYLLIYVKNSFSPEERKSSVDKKGGGLGLTNARKRLDLLYPGEYQLTVSQENQFYTVLLQLPKR